MIRLTPLRLAAARLAAAAVFFTGTALAAPKILIYGSGYPITTGSTVPIASDGTDFGPVAVASTPVKHTFTIYNTGDQALTISNLTVAGNSFQLSGPAPTAVPPVSTVTFDVTFVAPAIGTQTGSVSVSSNDPNAATYTFAIKGQGGVPKISISGNGIALPSSSANAADGTDFGAVTLGTSLAHSFVVTNSGDGDLTFSASQFPNNSFPFEILTPLNTVVPAGSSAELKLKFTPYGVATYTRTLRVGSNDPSASLITFSISGSGTSPTIGISGNNTAIVSGATVAKAADGTLMPTTSYGLGDGVSTYTITNSGAGRLLLGDIVVSNPDNFTAELLPAGTTEIAPGATGTLQLTFHPVAAGTYDSLITLPSNDSTTPSFSFDVRGVALASSLNVGGIVNGDVFPDVSDGTDFGSVKVGSSVTHNFPLTNNGPGDLQISIVQVQSLELVPDGSFAPGTSAQDVILHPAETLQLPVTFTPDQQGQITSQIIVQTSGHPPYTFNVTGVGLVSTLVVGAEGAVIASGDTTPSTADGTSFGSSTIGLAPVKHTIPLRNTGNLPLQVVAVTSSDATDFAVTSPSTLPATIPGGGEASLEIAFAPRTPGVHSSTISIQTASGLHFFLVDGTGISRVPAPGTPAAETTLNNVPFSKALAGSFSGSLIGFDPTSYQPEDSHGHIDAFNVTPGGAFSCRGTADGMTFTVKGAFAADGTYEGFFKLPGNIPATITFYLATGADGSVHIVGQLVWSGPATVFDLVRSGKVTLAADKVGTYTCLIPADDAAPLTEPHGDGIATLTLRSNGTLTFQYRLGDGTSGTRSATLTPSDTWQLYLPAYGSTKLGSLSGEVSFRDIAGTSDLDGTIYWTRAANAKSTTFPTGFSIKRQVIGSKYVPAAKGSFALAGLTAGTNNATLVTGPAGISSLDVPFTWTAADKLSATGLALKVNRNTGLITGTYTAPGTKVRTSLYAVIFQKQGIATGLATGTGAPAYLSLTPAETP